MAELLDVDNSSWH